MVSEKLIQCTRDIHDRETQKLADYQNKIDLLNPTDILTRGFAVVSTADKKRVTSARELSENQKIIIRFADAKVDATINHIGK